MKIRIQPVGAPSASPLDFFDAQVTIGRDAGCDLPLDGVTNVSGRHARIELTSEGAYLIDLGSTNGTFLNDRRVEGRLRLTPGDHFRLGQAGPQFRIVDVVVTSSTTKRVTNTAVAEVIDAEELSEPEPEYPVFSQAAVKVKRAPKPVKEAPAPSPRASAPPKAADGQTRLMVVSLQKSNQRLMIGLALAAVGVLILGSAVALYFFIKTHDLANKASDLGDAAKKLEDRTEGLNQAVGHVTNNVEKLSQREGDVYRKVLPSTAWILNQQGKQIGAGTGAYIDSERKLVLSNHHVAAKGQSVFVFFPAFDNAGKVKMSTDDYPFTEGIRGTTVLSDPKCDLCLIRLEKAPPTPRPLKLAARSAEPGDRIHSIGNFRAFGTFSVDRVNNGVLWSYAGGAVRNVRQTRQVLPDQVIDAWVLETQSPINQGDSGGPVVNDAGELVAVVSTYDSKTRLVSSFIDIREVHAFVARHAKR